MNKSKENTDINVDRVKLEIQGSTRLSVKDLRKLATKITLDKSDTGFVKVLYRFYETRKGLGKEMETDQRYERPPMIIPEGAFCSSCDNGEGRVGGQAHDENCDLPHSQYLFSTVGFFKKELIDQKPGALGPNTTLDTRIKEYTELKELRDRWNAGELTTSDIEDTLNSGVRQTRGNVKVVDGDTPTDIKYREVKPLSGKDTLKETPSDWKNAVCIYYISSKGKKTQFRIDKEGKILVLEFPFEDYKDGSIVREITKRISKVIPTWKPLKKKPAVLDMTIRSLELTSGEIDIEKLKRDLFPLREDKRYANAEHLKAEQEYARGPSKLVLLGPQLTMLSGNPTLEIPIVEPPKTSKKGRILFKLRFDGINYSVQIYKKGSVQINVSYFNRLDTSQLSYKKIQPVILTVFKILQELLIEKTASKIKASTSTLSKNYTVSGSNLPTRENTSSSVCRGAKPGIPSPQPQPYSFRGKCPLPGQFIYPLEGFKGKDGRYYPCCGKLTKTGKKSESKYRQQLLNGFPNSEEARNAGVPTSPDTEDKLSGVLPKDFDKPGTKLQVKLSRGEGWINVKMKSTERNGKFTVTTDGGKQVVISRKDIKPESRFLLGVSNLLKQRETTLREKFGKQKGNKLYRDYLCALMSSVGRMCPGSEIKTQSTKQMSQEEALDITASGLDSVPFFYLTYTEIQKLVNYKYGVVSVPDSSQIVALRKGKETDTVNIVDLENGSLVKVKDWKGFGGTLIGCVYKSGNKNVFVIWKIGENGSTYGIPPPKWKMINALEKGGVVQENIVEFCKNTTEAKLNKSTLIFVPIPRRGFSDSGSTGSSNTPLVWTSKGVQNKPHITLQLLQEINRNKQKSEWIVGTEGSVFPRTLLGKRPRLTIKIKNTDVTKMKLIDIPTQQRYVFVKPQFNREGILDTDNPFVILGLSSRGEMPKRSLENAISMCVSRPPSRIFKPLKYKGETALFIDGKYYIFDEDVGKLEIA
tara:strand:+ start:11176 stop:14115 length:2940 start_codon:yes stop_codon:yes gene_type:complete